MASFSVSESAVVAAPPATVHRVLADYREHHPRILPKPEFESLVVERGGVGAGTVVLVGMRVMGQRSSARLVVSEPEPGRVLREADAAGGVDTTFTVEPAGEGQSRVTIATTWRRKPGLRGLVESWTVPRVARGLYRRELALLDEHARRLA